MRNDHWLLVALVALGTDACRGSYLGTEQCGGMLDAAGGDAGANVAAPSPGGQDGCDCPCANPPAGAGGEGGQGGSVVHSGGSPGSGPGGAGSGGSQTGESGAAGQGGSGAAPNGDPCSSKPPLPTPTFHASFWDCNDGIGTIDATIGRPAGSYTGVKDAAVVCIDGPVGKAADFQGGEIRFADGPAIDLEYDASIAVWVRQDSAHSAGAFARWYGNDQFALTVEGTLWKFMAAFSPDPNDQSIVDYYSVQTTLELGTWTHLVWVVRRGSEMKLFKNGVYVPQGNPKAPQKVMTPAAFQFKTTSKELRLGRTHGEAWDTWFDGALDELRIYKTALSDAEAVALACPE